MLAFNQTRIFFLFSSVVVHNNNDDVDDRVVVIIVVFAFRLQTIKHYENIDNVFGVNELVRWFFFLFSYIQSKATTRRKQMITTIIIMITFVCSFVHWYIILALIPRSINVRLHAISIQQQQQQQQQKQQQQKSKINIKTKKKTGVNGRKEYTIVPCLYVHLHFIFVWMYVYIWVCVVVLWNNENKMWNYLIQEKNENYNCKKIKIIKKITTTTNQRYCKIKYTTTKYKIIMIILLKPVI